MLNYFLLWVFVCHCYQATNALGRNVEELENNVARKEPFRVTTTTTTATFGDHGKESPHYKHMHGAVATYKFGGFGVMGYLTEQEEKSSSHPGEPKVTRDARVRGYYLRDDDLLPISSSHSDHTNEKERKKNESSTTLKEYKLKDQPVLEVKDEFPVYYLEDLNVELEEDKGKEKQEDEDEEQNKSMVDEKLLPMDVDTVGWID